MIHTIIITITIVIVAKAAIYVRNCHRRYHAAHDIKQITNN